MHPAAGKFFTLPAAIKPFFLTASIMPAPILVLAAAVATSGTRIILPADTTSQPAKPKSFFGYKPITFHLKFPHLFSSIKQWIF
jgi:hypothetical protein